jgi:hypothetical protein
MFNHNTLFLFAAPFGRNKDTACRSLSGYG